MIEAFAATYPIWFHSIIIIASLAVIVKAAEMALVGIIWAMPQRMMIMEPMYSNISFIISIASKILNYK